MMGKIEKVWRENKILASILIICSLLAGFLGVGFFNLFQDLFLLSSTEECLAPEQAVVTKVLDGDTILVEGGEHVRLIGIEADEKDYPCFEQAKLRLEDLILDKTVRLEQDISDVDLYGRCLRYVFLDGENINIQMVAAGMAVARFYEPDTAYKDEIVDAEQQAKENNLGCKWE